MLLALLALSLTPAGEPAPEIVTVTSRGAFILDQAGKAVPPDDFRRGLQTSGLCFAAGELFSVGDQRSQYPACLFRIDPGTARLLEAPSAPVFPQSPSPIRDTYLRRVNPDFEAVTLLPGVANTFLAAIEMDGPWVVRFRRDPVARKLHIESLVVASLPWDLAPYNRDANYGFEGIAVDDDRRAIYVAFERDAEGLPRILRFSWPAGSAVGSPAFEEVPVPFATLPPRAGKGRLNVNGLAFLRTKGGPLLIMLARDWERLLVYHLEERRFLRIVDLDLRGPEGERLMWASPEGVAVDPAGGRLWVVSDPDSIRGNYRRLEDEQARDLYADMAPFLFTIRLDRVVPQAGGTP